MMVWVLLVLLFFVWLSNKDAMTKIKFRVSELEAKVKELTGGDVKVSKNTQSQAGAEEYVETNKTMGRAEEPIPYKKPELKRPVPSYPSIKEHAYSIVEKIKEEEKVDRKEKQEEVVKVAKKEKSAFWAKIEEMFAANATGFIGVAAVVVGVVFLAIYAAISMGPIARFITVCGFSVLFYVLYFILSRYEIWKSISLWMRTASGVVFLIGCVGSSQFAYMRWITDIYQSWAMIILGIAVNITFGVWNKKELFAMVHVVLSLLVLLIVPFSYTSFIIASVISSIGLIVALGNKKWDIHIAVVNLTFMLLNLFWSRNYFASWPESTLPTILLCLFVSVPCLLNHYRSIYKGWDNRALKSHLVIWLSLGISLYLHSRGTIWSTIGLGFASIMTLALSFYANKIKADWLFVCDRLTSLVLAVVTCMTCYKFDLEYFHMVVMSLVLSLAFLKINTYTPNKTVFNINLYATVSLYVISFMMFLVKRDYGIEHFIFMISSFAISAVLVPSIEQFNRENKFGFSTGTKDGALTTTFLMPIFSFTVLAVIYAATVVDIHNNIWYAVSFAMCAYLVIFNAYYKDVIFDDTSRIITILASVYYIALAYFKDYTVLLNLQLTIMTLSLGILFIIFSWSDKRKKNYYHTGIALVWGVLMFASYKFTITYSTMLPSLLWLIVFLGGAELKEISWKKAEEDISYSSPSAFIVKLSKLALVAFIIRFALIDLSNHTLIMGFIPSRVGTELLSIMVLFYWMFTGTKKENEYIKKNINMMLEVFLALAIFYIAAELPVIEQGMTYAIFALVSINIGPKLKSYNRMTMYSYILYLIALFNVGFVASNLSSPSFAIYDQVWFRNSVTVLLSIIFAFIADRKSLHKNNELFLDNKLSKAVYNLIVKYDLKILIYPLFVAIAFFLFRGFDKSILSILWMVECFALFVVSIVKGKSEFRAVSMAGVAFIFARIMFYDLRGQDFLVKAIVFIVVGSILIIMNAIYSKYKHRYEVMEKRA